MTLVAHALASIMLAVGRKKGFCSFPVNIFGRMLGAQGMGHAHRERTQQIKCPGPPRTGPQSPDLSQCKVTMTTLMTEHPQCVLHRPSLSSGGRSILSPGKSLRHGDSIRGRNSHKATRPAWEVWDLNPEFSNTTPAPLPPSPGQSPKISDTRPRCSHRPDWCLPSAGHGGRWSSGYSFKTS